MISGYFVNSHGVRIYGNSGIDIDIKLKTSKEKVVRIFKALKTSKQLLKPKKRGRKRNYESMRLKYEFRKVRVLALQRDNYRCTDCGSNDNLHVHHLNKLSESKDNSLDNLITLCGDCHKQRHINDGVYLIM